MQSTPMSVLCWTAVTAFLLACHCSAFHDCIHDKVRASDCFSYECSFSLSYSSAEFAHFNSSATLTINTLWNRSSFCNRPAYSFQIALEHLPTIQTRGDGHEKRLAAEFSPIRITPRFIEPLSSTFRSQLTNETGVLMKVLSFISHTLLVRQISGTIKIPPTCEEYTYGPNKGKCRILHTSTTQCGPYLVPSQYLGTRQVCTSPYGTCHEIGGNGIGAANTDFLLFIGTQCRLKLFLTAIACILIACALQLVLCCSCIQQVACSYICSIS